MSDNGNGNGNGHGRAVEELDRTVPMEFNGANLELGDLIKKDGVLTRNLSAAQISVLQRAQTAITDDKDYRQELKTAFFLNKQEAANVVAAITEAKRYNLSMTPIIDWVIANSAGLNGGRLKAIFETISHTTLTTNNIGQNKNRWWNRSNDSSKSSPLS